MWCFAFLYGDVAVFVISELLRFFLATLGVIFICVRMATLITFFFYNRWFWVRYYYLFILKCCLIGARSLVTQGTIIPPHSLVMGVARQSGAPAYR